MLSDDDFAWNTDEDAHDPQAPHAVTDPEEWMDHWSEELVVLWHGLREHAQSMGAAVLDKCAFPDFAEFCFKFSSGHPPAV